VVTHQLQVERWTGKVRQSETDVIPLCHATNCDETKNDTSIEYGVQVAGVDGEDSKCLASRADDESATSTGVDRATAVDDAVHLAPSAVDLPPQSTAVADQVLSASQIHSRARQ